MGKLQTKYQKGINYLKKSHVNIDHNNEKDARKEV